MIKNKNTFVVVYGGISYNANIYSHYIPTTLLIMTALPAFTTVPPPALATADGWLLTSGGMTKGLPPEMWGIQP